MTWSEIILPQSVTRLPNMPEFAEGIINLRGRIIPIIGLSKQFGLQHRGDASAARIVVAGIGGMAIGLVVDDVVGVERVAASSIQPAPSILSVGTAVVRGVTRVDDRVVILLDQDRILLHEEQRLLQAAPVAGNEMERPLESASR